MSLVHRMILAQTIRDSPKGTTPLHYPYCCTVNERYGILWSTDRRGKTRKNKQDDLHLVEQNFITTTSSAKDRLASSWRRVVVFLPSFLPLFPLCVGLPVLFLL